MLRVMISFFRLKRSLVQSGWSKRVKVDGPSKSGRSWAKLDGHSSQSGRSRTIVDGLLSQTRRSEIVKKDGVKVPKWTVRDPVLYSQKRIKQLPSRIRSYRFIHKSHHTVLVLIPVWSYCFHPNDRILNALIIIANDSFYGSQKLWHRRASKEEIAHKVPQASRRDHYFIWWNKCLLCSVMCYVQKSFSLLCYVMCYT